MSSPAALPRPPSRRAVAVFMVATCLLAAVGLLRHAYARNFGRPYDPYRASAVALGLPDWPIRGNRVTDRRWMHDHLYCCTPREGGRVLFAGDVPGGAITLTEALRDGHPVLFAGIFDGEPGGHGEAYDYGGYDDEVQVSYVGWFEDATGRRRQPLVVVGAPGTEAVTYSTTGPRGPFQPLRLSRGAGVVDLDPDVRPRNVVVRVRRAGRIAYQGTVTAIAFRSINARGEGPAPLVPLTPEVARLAGPLADDVAGRFCAAAAYDELPRLLRGEAAAVRANLPHRGVLRGRIEEMAQRLGPLRGQPAEAVRRALPAGRYAAVVRERCAYYIEVMGE